MLPRRRYRSLLVAAAVATLGTGLTSATSAATPAANTVVDSAPGKPAILGSQVSCPQQVAEPADGYRNATDVVGPQRPPLGTGSLALTSNFPFGIDAGFGLDSEPATSLTALSTGYLNHRATPGFLEVDLNESFQEVDDVLDRDVVRLALPRHHHWRTADLLSQPLEAEHYHSSDTEGIVVSDQTTETWRQFVASHPDATINDIAISDTGCSGTAGHLNLDALTIGFGATSTTYNFDAQPTSPSSDDLVGIFPPKRAGQGRLVTVPGYIEPSRDLDFFPGRAILQVRPAGTVGWHRVAVVDGIGNVEAPARLTTTSSFRWHYTGDPNRSPATSSVATVHALPLTAVSIAADRRHVATSRPVTLSGRISPHRNDVSVTVYDGKPRFGRLVGGAYTTADGRWSIHRRLASGRHVLYATVGRYAQHAANRSNGITVTVRSS